MRQTGARVGRRVAGSAAVALTAMAAPPATAPLGAQSSAEPARGLAGRWLALEDRPDYNVRQVTLLLRADGSAELGRQLVARVAGPDALVPALDVDLEARGAAASWAVGADTTLCVRAAPRPDVASVPAPNCARARLREGGAVLEWARLRFDRVYRVPVRPRKR
jgi:hypothetical protein